MLKIYVLLFISLFINLNIPKLFAEKNEVEIGSLESEKLDWESSFSDLVSEYSIGTEKKFNGIIGPVELGRLDPALAERLKISKNCSSIFYIRSNKVSNL